MLLRSRPRSTKSGPSASTRCALGYWSVDKKLVVVPKEAETVRLIFRRYLEVGSIRALMRIWTGEAFPPGNDRSRMAASRAESGSASVPSPICCATDSAFCEVVYRGAVHRGEHEPIVDRALFDAVQEKLAASATARELRLKPHPRCWPDVSSTTGQPDDPTHTNKRRTR